MKYIITIVGREIKDSGYLLVVCPERPLHKLCFIQIIEQIGERKKTVNTDRTVCCGICVRIRVLFSYKIRFAPS